MGIKSSQLARSDPESVVISYRPLDTSEADWDDWDIFPTLDPIDLAWADDERMLEHKIALSVDGMPFAPETTAMRFEFAAKGGQEKSQIAVQQIRFFGISRQKALYYEFGDQCGLEEGWTDD